MEASKYEYDFYILLLFLIKIDDSSGCGLIQVYDPLLPMLFGIGQYIQWIQGICMGICNI